MDAVRIAFELLLHTQRGVERAVRVILVRNRSAEEREDSISGRLRDVAVESA
jgi:hypothetical protein